MEEKVRANLELSLRRKPMEKAQAMFFNALFDAKSGKKKIWPPLGKTHAVIRKNAGLFLGGTGSGRQQRISPEVLKKICANFEEVMFRAFLTES